MTFVSPNSMNSVIDRHNKAKEDHYQMINNVNEAKVYFTVMTILLGYLMPPYQIHCIYSEEALLSGGLRMN